LVENAWTQIRNDEFGEYFIRVMLNNWLSGNKSTAAAEGWGGDNMTYYENGNDYLFTWNIVWDSSQNATRFSNAFGDMISATGAMRLNSGPWYANGRYLSIDLNQTRNSTMIACSTVRAAVEPSFFESP
jgi:hypothetical protein